MSVERISATRAIIARDAALSYTQAIEKHLGNIGFGARNISVTKYSNDIHNMSEAEICIAYKGETYYVRFSISGETLRVFHRNWKGKETKIGEYQVIEWIWNNIVKYFERDHKL